MVRAVNGETQICTSPQCIAAINANAPQSVLSNQAAPVDSDSQRVPRHASVNVPATHIQRAQVTFNRLNPWAQARNLPTSPLSSSALAAYEKGGPGMSANDEKITVCWQFRISKNPKTLDSDLGLVSRRWSANMFMTDIKDEVLKQINPEWTRKRNAPLLPEEASIRWHGNKIPEQNTASLSLHDFYKAHSGPSVAGQYLQGFPSVWKHIAKEKKPFVCLELYVHLEAFDRRTDPPANDTDEDEMILVDTTTNFGGRKQGAASQTPAGNSLEGPLTKYAAGSQALGGIGSQFRPMRRTAASKVHTISKVSLRKIVCQLDAFDFTTTFIASDLISGFIQDIPFSSGAMKHAYDFMTSNNTSMVVKRFYRLREANENANPTDSDGRVSIGDQKFYIQSEISRIEVGKWFLAAFYQHARKLGVDVFKNIAFVDAFLALEEQLRPSVASGHGQHSTDDDTIIGEGLTWLVEPKRTKVVERFTHTLHHKAKRNDLRGSTIYAFSHFAFGHSNSTLVFADIQGSPAMVNGEDGLVLFDIITHTSEGDSGIGDFGEEGIDTFLRDHRCNTVCKALQLHHTVPLSTVEKAKDKGKRVRKRAASSVHRPPKKQRSVILEPGLSDSGEGNKDKEVDVEVNENAVEDSGI